MAGARGEQRVQPHVVPQRGPSKEQDRLRRIDALIDARRASLVLPSRPVLKRGLS